MLAPGLFHVSPFMGLAILGPQASLSVTVGITDIGQQAIATQLIKLSRKSSAEATKSFLMGKSMLKPIQYSTRGKAEWDEAILSTSALCHETPRECGAQSFGTASSSKATSTATDAAHLRHITICPSCN